MARDDRYLVISDLQVPFEHPEALKFCKTLVRDYRIPKENIINVGDETDQYFGGLWKKSPEAEHTPNSELEACRQILYKWYKAFPYMRLCTSNHGTRYWRKALDAEIPSQLLRRYEEVIDAPPGWKWKKNWIIKTKHPFNVEHGDDFGGKDAHINAAMFNGISTVIGHHHTLAGVRHIETKGMKFWAAASGSLIDFEQYAFEYARNSKLRPKIGAIVVVDNGRNAIWIPL